MVNPHPNLPPGGKERRNFPLRRDQKGGFNEKELYNRTQRIKDQGRKGVSY